MASNILTQRAAADAQRPSQNSSFASIVVLLLKPFASLRLTVALFAMAIFLIFAGTLAQVDKDIWEVMGLYFRTFFAWIDFQVFFPASFFPSRPIVPGGFWFPGGFMIGGLMAINLLAAHGLRFKVQARGARLATGLATIAVGAGLTWLVVMGGSGKETIEGATLSGPAFWEAIKAGLLAISLAAAYGAYRLGGSRQIERWILAGVGGGLGVLVAWLYYAGDAAALTGPSMRILWQLFTAAGATGVLLAGCILVFKKRAGIVLLHAGVALMMANELVVYRLHHENQMFILEGQTVNYAHDIRTLELAVADLSDPKFDQGVVIPKARFKGVVRSDLLPFRVKFIRFFQNAELKPVAADPKNPATAGAGLRFVPREVRPGAGADSSAKSDSSAAYVQLLDKESGRDLGIYLVSVELLPQKVKVGEVTYDLALRHKRTYRPYSMHLYDARSDNYLGTKVVKNYSSELRLVDADKNVDRKVKIWMNNPLRYAGETFYQSEFHLDTRSGQEGTTLQVVTNTGWMIPYVACVIVAMGMLAHFVITLLRFLNRMDRADDDPRPDSPGSAHARGSRETAGLAGWLVPTAIVAFFGLYVARQAMPPRVADAQMQIGEFGKLPLLYEGRVKPFDTLARNSLVILSGKQTYVLHGHEDEFWPTKQPAIKWLLDVISGSPAAFKQRVVRIENLEVLETLGLERRSGYRYSIEEFQGQLGEFQKQVKAAAKVAKDDVNSLSVYQKKLLEVDKKLNLLMLLMASFDRPTIRPEEALKDLSQAIQQQQQLAEMHPPLVIPPENSEETWEPYSTAYTKAFAKAQVLGQKPNPATVAFDSMLIAYRKGDAPAFNKALAKYENRLSGRAAEVYTPRRTNFEAFFNHFAPFYQALALYVVAFVVGCMAWLGWRRPLTRTSTWLIVLALLVHTFAIVARIYISGRPPVTNLYSSAVFIGWACVALSLVLEAIYRLNVGNIVAAVAGFASLLIAHNLSSGGDTFIVLQAVLDTQFWLATHVVCITLGYATTYLAGMLGLVYILRGTLTPSLSPQVAKDIARMIYGVICFAIFFSFVGTVLGGLWADDSWGRFWGWDPKENGALIIVLWNALVLHARWGGMVGERGLAVLAVGGNIVTSWSWFGVNELGVGLHSYGFTDGVLLALGLFILSQLGVIALGLLPKAKWWSSRAAQPAL